MFTRIRVAFGFAFMAAIFISVTAFAKGGFSFIGIRGADLKEELRVSDLALTEDFFAFANFYEDKTEAPADPGLGYEITRYYIDNNLSVAFDQLHYYPYTGFVYYDGISGGGSSEYDGKWYTAKPEIKTVFESALLNQPQSAKSSGQTPFAPALFQNQPSMWIAITAGLVALLVLAFWLRRPSTN